ncbi:MAG: RodZ domain-containing protein, partial [Acidimicrobiales bacterium]
PPAAAARHAGTIQVQVPTTSLVDTGVVPAYQPPTAARGPRRPRTPLGLRILVGVAGLAVLAGVAGLLVDHFEPAWLQDLGITHRPHTPPARDDSVGTSTTAQTAPQATFAVASTAPGSATLAVRSPTFTVQLTAVGGSSWVQATAAGKAAPTYAGVLTAGASQTFTVQHSMAVQLGSVAAHVVVSVGGKVVGTYVPTSAPCTVTLQSVP